MAKNYYDILGIRHDATAVDIKRAYIRLAKELHPDKIRQSQKTGRETSMRFQALTEAYETLKHPERRAVYDSMLRPQAGRHLRVSNDNSGPPGKLRTLLNWLFEPLYSEK